MYVLQNIIQTSSQKFESKAKKEEKERERDGR
jgi:hypothetical protein